MKSYLIATKISMISIELIRQSARYWRGGLSIGLVWKPQLENVFARNWLFLYQDDLPSKNVIC